MGRGKKKRGKRVSINSLEQINLKAAGIDIGADEIWVCVPESVTEENIRPFETQTPSLQRCIAWLKACDVETVAMESTGVYWIPIYELLEAAGFEVYLVNAKSIKNVSGRKSDVLDSQWIQQLHTYGLLQKSFRPTSEICELRTYVRQRESILQQRGSQTQRMQKALHLMNVKLTTVVTDITGKTGMKIIRDILRGNHDPQQLAQYRDHRCKASAEEIAAALTGNYRAEHLFCLRQAVEAYDFYTQQLAVCEEQLEGIYQTLEGQVDVTIQPLKPKKPPHTNHPEYDLRTYLYEMCGVDLTDVDGLSSLLVQDIIAEIGVDMSPWPTDKHFASWLGLAPNTKSSAGRVMSRRTKKTNNRATTALRLAAQTVGRTQTALGIFYRRIRAKHGAPIAVTATARKIGCIVYHMLKKQVPYQPQSIEAYTEQQQVRYVNQLRKRAKKLGMHLVPLTEG